MSGELELKLRDRLAKLKRLRLPGGGISDEVRRIEQQLEQMDSGDERDEDEIWRSVEFARHPERPYTLDYIERLIGDWIELHGDRARMDDPAVVSGLGSFAGRTVAVIGHQKGRGDAVQRVKRNFGMSNPEGYRKAMRVMDIANRHGFPLITFVDTPGAYPGVAAEQHGQGGALAASQAAMARLTVPIVACVIGEGGSGGAIAFALANRVLMQQFAIYSVISPEGCASILWRDAGQARKAAAAFRPDAVHCLELGVIDDIHRLAGLDRRLRRRGGRHLHAAVAHVMRHEFGVRRWRNGRVFELEAPAVSARPALGSGHSRGGVGVEHPVRANAHQDLSVQVCEPRPQCDRVIAGVEDEQWERALAFEQVGAPAYLVDRGPGGIDPRRHTHGIERCGPAIGSPVELGDPLIGPTRHDGLAGRMLRGRVVEPPFGTGLGIAAIPD